MINWEQFIWFGIAAVILWITGAAISFKREKLGTIVYSAGALIFTLFIILFWISIQRAPMRTMGETRLWYSFYVSATSLILYIRWKYKFLLPFGAVLSTVFTIINIVKPEIHSTMLMPALQSAWFIPHVSVYMLAYAVVAVAQIIGIASLFNKPGLITAADNLVRVGTAFILIGMLMGAVWAKQAWGNYWAWDSKENWAAVTWLFYISYMHIRFRMPEKKVLAITVMTLAFIALQITWYGVNYMPAAQKSMHTYTM